MVLLSFINPLSTEGEEIVREKGSLEQLFDRNVDLLRIVTQSKSQNISDDTYVPETLADLAVKRVEWYLRKKNDKTFDHNDYAFLFDPEIAKFDVIAFYIAAQAIGIKFNPNSRESRVFMEAQGKLVEERLEKLHPTERREAVSKLLNTLLQQDNIKWTSLSNLLGSKKISLSDLVLDQGEVILNRADFLLKFEDKIVNRPPEKMYDLLIGQRIKELIINRMIMHNTENYIKKVHEMASNIEPHPALIQIADKISEKLAERSSFFSSSGGGGGAKAATLQNEAFPPCIMKTMEGVGSGNRNDAIVLLLTSFLSYARLYPSVFRNEISVKVSDVDSNLQIVNNEIIPLIYEAAENCSPPLFEDDPQEKLNVIAKLGFGVHSEADLKHEGESKWYTPMSCDKIKIHLSPLCRPDATCKKIGNPLSYYNRRRWEIRNSPPDESSQSETKSESDSGSE
jgi:DNA primase large subunit